MRGVAKAMLASVLYVAVFVWQFGAVLRLLRGENREPTSSEPEPDVADDPARRRALAAIGAGAGGVTAVAIGGPVTAFLVAPMFRDEEPVWRALGDVNDFEEGSTVRVTFDDPSPVSWSGRAAQSAAWLRRLEGERFEAFSIHCTHLGCAVRWLEGASLFMCPCHGGAFYGDGEPAAGPVRRPLARHEVQVQDGTVYLRTLGLPVTGPITTPE